VHATCAGDLHPAGSFRAPGVPKGKREDNPGVRPEMGGSGHSHGYAGRRRTTPVGEIQGAAMTVVRTLVLVAVGVAVPTLAGQAVPRTSAVFIFLSSSSARHVGGGSRLRFGLRRIE
jgi:hypothetical protein